MERANIENMELGNILFGHSRGEFHIPRTEGYQGVFVAFLERSGFGPYGEIVNPKLNPFRTVDDLGFENDTFIIRPYYWGDDDDKTDLPNFVYKSEGIEISWYKYPFRDAYCNKNISEPDFFNMLAECEKSLDSVYGGKQRIVERRQTIAEYMEEMAKFDKEFSSVNNSSVAAVKAELEKSGQAILKEKATKEDAARFEEDHDVILPQLYKEFLFETDGADLFPPAGVQIYGVAHKPIVETDNPDVPGNDSIVIGALANGDPILARNGKQEVFIYDREAGRIHEDETYADFLDFLNDLQGIV